jgi:hypothetical protein
MSDANPGRGSDQPEATAQCFNRLGPFKGLSLVFSQTILRGPKVPPTEMARLRRKVRQDPRNA